MFIEKHLRQHSLLTACTTRIKDNILWTYTWPVAVGGSAPALVVTITLVISQDYDDDVDNADISGGGDNADISGGGGNIGGGDNGDIKNAYGI